MAKPVFYERISKWQRKICRERIAKYGFHPTCIGCTRKRKCMVPAWPGYVIECHQRRESHRNESNG